MEVSDGTLRYGSIHFDGSISRRPDTTTIQGTTYLALPQDVVFSRIDIRNGAIGVVPNEFGSLAFTNEYPIYDVNAVGRVIPDFVRLLCRTQVFRSQVEALVVGHSGRKRVSAEMFEDLPIPAPPIDDQRAIVERHMQHVSEAMCLRRKAADALAGAVDEITRLLDLKSPDVAPITKPFVIPSHRATRWSVFAATAVAQGISDELQSCYPVKPLGDPELSLVSYGIQKSPRNRPDKNGRPYLRVANVQDAYLDLREIKYIDVPDAQMDTYRLEPGDILFCEGNSAELVGRPALWGGEIEDCVHQNHVLRARLNQDALLPQYLMAFMQTAPSRGHFRRRAKKTTNLATINSSDVRELLVPIPPIAEQNHIADLWVSAQEEAAKLRAAASEAEKKAFTETEVLIAGG
ncbi:hypothetical protein [Nocardia abscessus]|uniref:restriction endonuclease subunit S n=1 Tax=Nocardia abscessus TaxID=120957 RepID=UPI0024544AFD|nr:hypothetical protein [Nocardia abscessus]